MHTYERSERVEHLVQREVCDLLLRKVKDPWIQHVTITSVRVTRDLRFARIYYTIPREDEDRSAEVQTGLVSATGFVRASLGKRLRLRRAPQIHFMRDELYEQALDVSNSIAALERQGNKGSADE